MKKIFVSIAAAGILVAGAFAISNATTSSAFAQTEEVPGAEVPATEAPAVERPDFAKPEEILDEVLAGLVTDGTLDQGEADAVKAALEARHEEVRAEREEWRANNPDQAERGRKGGRGHKHGSDVREYLEDGVIDATELAELPDDHPLKDSEGPAAEFLDDGELTEDELRQIGDQLHERRAGDRGTSTDA